METDNFDFDDEMFSEERNYNDGYYRYGVKKYFVKDLSKYVENASY